MTITIKTTLDELPALLKNFGDQIPYATANALNETAFGLMREEKANMDKHLDIKNTYTARGMRVKKASKTDLTAVVGHTAGIWKRW